MAMRVLNQPMDLIRALEVAITPTRNLSLTYIIADCVFLCLFIGLLVWRKKYQTLIFALLGGILYFIVDFGGFYLWAGSREVYLSGQLQDAGMTALVLLWMSLSYGITNFAYIWMLLRKDKEGYLLSFFIVMWWLVAPSLCSFDHNAYIMTTRTTGEYHFIMAIFLVVGYTLLIIHSLYDKRKLYSLIHLNLVGISVQFFWEFALLVNGIRPMDGSSIVTLIVNSLIETNMGMPYIFLIYFFVNQRWNEDLSRFEGEKIPFLLKRDGEAK